MFDSKPNDRGSIPRESGHFGFLDISYFSTTIRADVVLSWPVVFMTRKNQNTEKAREVARTIRKANEIQEADKAQKTKKLSKALSYVLRHHPDSVGITLEEGGWTNVDSLCKAMNRPGRVFTREILEQVVANNDKQRFEFDSEKTCIRARQGHSVEIDLQYDSVEPPEILYHGTAKHKLDSILEQGLIKGNRHHVHMSTNRDTMLAVGARHGKPVLLRIDAKGMYANKHQFFITGNSVWLTDLVPPDYLTVVD